MFMNLISENFILNIFHIGGRNGTIEFPNTSKFNNYLKFFLFDADPESIEKIKENNKIAEVYPYCLLDNKKNINFNITSDPHASSIYNLNQKYKFYFTEHKEYDYLFSEALKVEKKINLSTISIDELVKQNKTPQPDYLSIDAEGAEYLILKGANNCLENNTVAIFVETNLLELYENQSTFKDIHEHLNLKNFILADMEISRFHYKRINKKLRGKNMPFCSDTMYFKDPKVLFDDIVKYNKSDNALKKLAFISFVYGFNEIGFDALSYLNLLNSQYDRKNLIINFLYECRKFEDKSNKEKSWGEFSEINNTEEIEKKQKEVKEKYKNPLLRKFINFKNAPYTYIKDITRVRLKKLKNIFFILTNFIPITLQFKIKKKTKFQIFLEKNGLFLASKNISNRN